MQFDNNNSDLTAAVLCCDTPGVCELEMCGSTVSATRPIAVADDAYPYPYVNPTHAENVYPA